MCHDLGEWKRGSVGIVAAANDLQIGGYGAEIVVGLTIGEISETESLANFSRGQKLLELQFERSAIERIRIQGAGGAKGIIPSEEHQ